MKWAATLLCCLNFGVAAELAPGRTVFLMPMTRGLDQFVANRLTRAHLLQVVTDPAKADVIFTDQVGAGFEDRLHELLPPPPKPETPESAKKKAEKAEEKTKERGDVPSSRDGIISMLGDPANKPEVGGSLLASRGRGNIFLVDVKTREVLWSAFERPKNSSPHEMDHTAERIVKQLKEDLNPPKAKQGASHE
jgi:hypothetical protein